MSTPVTDISGIVIRSVREGLGADDIAYRHRLDRYEVRAAIAKMRRAGLLTPEFFAPLPMASVPWPSRAAG